MIYLVTNRKLIKNNDIYNVVQQSVNAGIDAVILREKDLNHSELYKMAVKLKDITYKKNIPLIINGNLDVAKDINASGYHVGFETFKKEKIDFDGLLGVSVHSVDEAVLSEKLGANYIIAGHIFSTSCKPGLEPKGIDFIKKIRKKIKIPVIAIGGINKDNIKNIYLSGANGAAVMSGIMESNDISKTIRELKL